MKEPHGHKSRLRVKEQDSDPTVEGVREIRVPNASVTDEGKGIVSLAYDPAGTGDAEAAAHVLAHAGDDDAHHAVFTAAQHTAIGDGAPHHAQSHNHSAAGDGTALTPVTVDASTSVSADHLYEHTADHGIVLDGVKLKDNNVYAGVADTTPGYIYIYGDGADSAVGGRFTLFAATDYDAAFHAYNICVDEDDFEISTLSGPHLTIKADKSIEIPVGPLMVDHINEFTAAHGVNVEGVNLVDSFAELTEVAKPANPAANVLRVYAKDDGAGVTKLYGLDSAGTETAYGAGGGSMATDPIWAAAGDLAVATGNDAAGVLTKGTDGKVLTMVAGAVAWAAAAGGGAMATDPLWDAAGDLAVGTGANTGAKLALTVPGAANLMNVLGVVNGETTPVWKVLFDATHPEALGTAGEGSGVVAALRNHVHEMPKLDDVAAPDDNTDRNATTSLHGLVPKAVDPASAVQRHVVCIDNGETIYKNADLFDDTHPEPVGTATEGTSLLAAHRDHVHAAGQNHTLTAAPADDHTTSGILISLVAHDTQAFGDACFINASGEAALPDADAIASSSAVVMCADAAGIAADATGNYLLFGVARHDAWNWTVGGLVYLTVTGTTGNTLSQTAPTGTDDVIQILGVATHADRMLFRPSLVQVEHT